MTGFEYVEKMKNDLEKVIEMLSAYSDESENSIIQDELIDDIKEDVNKYYEYADSFDTLLSDLDIDEEDDDKPRTFEEEIDNAIFCMEYFENKTEEFMFGLRADPTGEDEYASENAQKAKEFLRKLKEAKKEDPVPLYKQEFPEFDTQLIIPEGFIDCSYHNDVCPHVEKRYTKEDGSELKYSLWQGTINRDNRGFEGKRLIFLVELNGDVIVHLTADHWRDIRVFIDFYSNLAHGWNLTN